MNRIAPFALAALLTLVVTAILASSPEREGPPEAVPFDAQLASVSEGAPARERTIRLSAFSTEIAASARHFLERQPRGYRNDCSGFVSAIFTRAGIEMDGYVASMWAAAGEAGTIHHHPIPQIGDLAFFDNTHDRDSNGELDDVRTHVAVVVDVEPDGTIVMAHKGSKRALIRMNLERPHDREDDAGNTLNSWLRRTSPKDDSVTMHLTGQLWSGFATVDPTTDWVAPAP